MGFRRPRPYLRSVAIPRGIELLLRVRMGCLCVHERTSQFGGRRANSTSGCPCCGAEVESLSHFMFDCPATSAQRDDMFAEIRSLPGCAEKLRSVLSMADSSIKVLRFVSDDIWGSSGRCLMVSPCIAAFLVKSWDVRNACKHSGAVLPPLSAPVGRGADGADAMA
ncbi:hypothetical protein COO60DRAFT_988393 [Scenedesmus sp. NREL 46B-D3]|nr:hypothetical protein COO60DRAFT_988393 [Scenedesmus sp. NREL 46B-D3]